MRLLLAAAAVIASASLTFTSSGCCTSAKCLDRKSSPDKFRVKAKRLRIGVVHNDSVSSPKRDRTDWKYVVLPKPGKLTVQLHWDNGSSQLELAVYDVLGVRIQKGRAWGSGGRRAVIAVEDPGRYYIRVRALSKRDESNYSLRLLWKPDRSGPAATCHHCTAGERKCLGSTGYIVCANVGENCNAWSQTHACPSGAPCSNGVCAGCTRQCDVGARRCKGKYKFQLCEPNAAGCAVWSVPLSCDTGRRCRRGNCRRRRPHVVHHHRKPPHHVKPDHKKSNGAKARIISIYRYRGRMTLHLEIGDNPRVKPGQIGIVLAGSTQKPLAGGEIKVVKVSGRYAIATTSLQKLGKNRWVLIKVQ